MGTRLFVSNLPYTVDNATLKDFVEDGKRQATRVEIVTASGTGQSRGFAFVELADDSQVQAAISDLNGRDLGGRPVHVAEVQDRGVRREAPPWRVDPPHVVLETSHGRPMLQVRRRLADWNSDPHALFDALRLRLSDDSASSMARASWVYSAAEFPLLATLLSVRDTGCFDVPLPSYLDEILALRRWRLGPDVDHVSRAFAAVVLVLAVNELDTTNESLAPLLESAMELGLADELEQLLVWLAEVRDSPQSRAWAVLALLLVRAKRAPDDPRLPALSAELAALDREATGTRDGWIFQHLDNDQQRDLWRSLAVAWLPRPAPAHLTLVRRLLE